MLNLIKKFITLILVNWLGLYVCQRIFPEIAIAKDFRVLITFLVILSALTVIIKPILDIILKPFIILTLGILSIIVNMGIVVLANKYSQAIIIDNNFSLFKVTFVLGLIGFLVNLVTGLNKSDF